MTTAQIVKTSVTVNNNSPIQDYVHPDDQTQPFEKVWNGAENREWDWGEVRLAHFSRVRLLRHALLISLLIWGEKNDGFAVHLPHCKTK